MITIDLNILAKDAYTLYCALIEAGFTQGHAMGIISQFLNYGYMQTKLQEEAEFSRITKEDK